MDLASMRLIVRPGEGVVARRKGVVLFVEKADEAALEDLLSAIDGRSSDAAEKLFHVVHARRPATVAPFCALVQDGAELRLAIHGPIQVESGGISYAGRDTASRIEESLGSDVSELRAGAAGSEEPAEKLLDLVEGAVRAG